MPCDTAAASEVCTKLGLVPSALSSPAGRKWGAMPPK